MRYVDSDVAWNIMNAYRGHALPEYGSEPVGQTLGSLADDESKEAEGSESQLSKSFITEVETSDNPLISLKLLRKVYDECAVR